MTLSSFYKTVCICMCCYCLTLSAKAITEPSEQAFNLFSSGNYTAAASSYKELSESDSLSPNEWLMYSSALIKAHKLDEAIKALKEVESTGQLLPLVYNNLACVYALKNQPDQSFEYMNKAIRAGYRDDTSLKTDPDLESIREDERFVTLVDQIARLARPCEFAEQYNWLDFWVADWEVYTRLGQLAGYNSITKDINSCAVFENWRSARPGGMTGKSMNFYNPATKKWVQQWVGDDGGVINMEADFDGTSMLFSGDHIDLTGETKKMRMTLTPLENGDVKQFIEESDDNGQTWYEWFAGIYKQKQ